jgi:hypothetical protein
MHIRAGLSWKLGVFISQRTNAGHIILYSTLVIGQTKYPGAMRISSWPFVPKKLRDTNRQDMVFIRQPRISDSAFQLRMGNIMIWFCKLLLLFVQNQYKDRH